MAKSFSEQEISLLKLTAGDIIKKMKASWPSHSASQEAFQYFMDDSPNGQTIVQVQIRVVTDETDFLPSFTTEFINNHNPKS